MGHGARVADLGCGFGFPLTAVLVEEGCAVYGVDASPKLLKLLTERLPMVRVECASVQEAAFSDEPPFDGCLAWGLLFLLPAEVQEQVIAKVAGILRPGGSFLFTAPLTRLVWADALSGAESVSLGAEAYRKLLQENGFGEPEEFTDSGDNYYYMSSYLGRESNRTTSS